MAVADTVASGTPERSLAQRMDALRRANITRSYRADLKRKIKAGERHVRDVIASPEDELATMAAFDVLLAAPKVGRVKAQKLLARARMSPSKTLGGMTDRQRRELVGLLRG